MWLNLIFRKQKFLKRVNIISQRVKRNRLKVKDSKKALFNSKNIDDINFSF